MGKTIKIGGVGKNPAIDKLNQVNELSSTQKAAKEMERIVFPSPDMPISDSLKQRQQIIKDFSIDFTMKNQEQG